MKGNKKILIFILVLIVILGACLFFNRNKINNVNNKDKTTEIANNEDKGLDDNNTQEEENQEKNNDEIEGEPIEIQYVEMDPQQVEIPILMYHSISADDPENGLLVPPDMFSEQMKWLSENGFTTMLLDDVVEALNTGKVPKKPVAITFDDGYADNYTAAFPILKENNMKATFFIITNNTDKDGYYMSSNMLKEMKEYGMAIENHTAYHFELAGASISDQKMSIEDGMNYLKDVIGVDSKYLCYPVGKFDENTIAINSELGIKAAVTTVNGFADISDNIYQLDRIRIAPMSIESFASIFSSFTD